MATVKITERPQPIRITKFLGINENTTGDTELLLGESSKMKNFRVRKENFVLEGIRGYEELFASFGETRIQGMWSGKLSGNTYMIFATNSRLYRQEFLSSTDLNSLDDTTYTEVDVIKTKTIPTSGTPTTGIDDLIRFRNKLDVELEEIDQASIDTLSNVGKYYYHSDKTLWLIVEKGRFADILEARAFVGEMVAYYEIGNLTDAPTNFFYFEDKVYIQNGYEYKSWNGTVLSDVVGYIPLIAVATPPDGGGTLLEQINLLTGKKHQQFSPATGKTTYQLAEKDITSVDKVIVAGTEMVVETDYTVDLTAGTVTFVNEPSAGTPNDVDIYWDKTSNNANVILGHTNSMAFGGKK